MLYFLVYQSQILDDAASSSTHTSSVYLKQQCNEMVMFDEKKALAVDSSEKCI